MVKNFKFVELISQHSRKVTGWNVFESEEANANVTVHSPLLRFHVRVATVIGKTRQVSLGSCVNDSDKRQFF